ncbi:MAG TPA: ATPase, T2SS/T4P/T4SS family [Oligoflexia bacterium]|nr:ATPase, T2SS/T4P/T4SS family [Oligoflexia bacterium]HMP48588.1 ATPase, T2SS/T4P/T4SS family [Oligoflexia bacterium]
MTATDFIIYQAPRQKNENDLANSRITNSENKNPLPETQLLPAKSPGTNINWRSLALCSTEKARNEIPLKIAKDLLILPLSINESFGYTELVIAISDESDEQELLSHLKLVSTLKCTLYQVPKDHLNRAIVSAYKTNELGTTLQNSISGSSNENTSKKETATISNKRYKLDLSEDKDSDIPKILQGIMNLAFQKNASDIHIESIEDNLGRISLRIDGIIIPQTDLNLGSGITEKLSRHIKVLCGLDITEHRKPQDGMFECLFASNKIRIRVSILPSLFGQKIAARLLYHPLLDEIENSGLNLLTSLGLLPEQERIFKNSLKKKGGIILLSGPTGSGKSSLLYALVNELCIKAKNIISIEDPVERSMSQITQVEVPDADYQTYKTIFKSILRQDPDGVVISEIRDSEAAHIAIEAALSGTLVISTIHASNCIDLLLRLFELKCSPVALGSCLKIISSQRLFPKNCPDCRLVSNIPEDITDKLKFSEKMLFYQSAGCNSCNLTGIRGRVAAYETCEPSVQLISELSRIYNDGLSNKSGRILNDALNQASYIPFSYSIRNLLLSGDLSIDNAQSVYF